MRNKWVFKECTSSKENKIKFGDLFNAQISIATLLNKAFIFKASEDCETMYQINDSKIEKDATRPAKSPRNLAYNIKERIIFPYFYYEDKLCRYSVDEFEKKYPETVKYLKNFESELQNRNKDNSAKWFEYGRSQALAHLNQEKLLISTVVTDNIKVYKLDKKDIPYAGIYITSKNILPLSKAIKILQSRKFFDYILEIGIQASGTSLRITPKDINNFEFDMEEF